MVYFASSAGLAGDTRLTALINIELDICYKMTSTKCLIGQFKATWSCTKGSLSTNYLCYKAGKPKWLDELQFSAFNYTTPAGFIVEPKDQSKTLITLRDWLYIIQPGTVTLYWIGQAIRVAFERSLRPCGSCRTDL